jgi:L-methionine (R)-S-oxide reductase
MPTLHADKVIASLREAGQRNATRQELLQRTADAIRAAGPPYTSVYLYMLHGDELVLEAHSGRDTEHVRILVGHGVCGTAVATGRDQNVGDVRAIENYIACNLHTRSELVVLIHRQGRILGQIDIDSDQLDPFTPAEEGAVREVAQALAVLLPS